jgi:hypothetical protein
MHASLSSLNFAVHLGAVDAASDRTVIVHIDPQAEHAPDDIQEVKQEAIMFEVNRPSSLVANLREMIGSGQAQQSLQRDADAGCPAANDHDDELSAHVLTAPTKRHVRAKSPADESIRDC